MKQLRMARLQAEITSKAPTGVVSACRIDYLKARLARKREESKGVLVNAMMYQEPQKLEAAE